jgi:hypothetical protein
MAITKHTKNSSTGAGAGKNSTKSANMSAFTARMPQSNYPKSGPMQTHLVPRATTSRPSITKESLRKRKHSDTTSSSLAASEHSDNEVDNMVASTPASKVAAFHKARGLSFEDLHVQSDDQGNASNLPASKKIPQKQSNRVMKRPAQKATVVEAATSPKPVSRKRKMADDDAMDAESSFIKRDSSAETKPASSDSELASSPIKRLKVSTPLLSNKRPAEEPTSLPAKHLKISTPLLSNKRPAEEPTSLPAKRLKINPPRPVASTPTVAAPSRSDKSKSKTKGGPVITKNGKVKKTPEYAVEHHFEGTPSNHGSSIERPLFATLTEPWCCANLACSTGMTWVPRDTKDANGKGPMGRKVISQFFGRNKGPTKLIPNDVWHFYCRKDYQRARYAAERGTTDELAKQVIDNLRDQLIRLKLWRPDALFQVQLDKGATDRLNSYFALLRQHLNDEAAALADLPAPKDPKKVKPEEAFPPALAEAFNQRFKTAGKDATANYDDIEAIIAWSEAEINAGNSTVFVPAEFLINPIQAGETVNDVSDNFSDWAATRDAHRAQASTASPSSAPAPPPVTSSSLPQPFDVVQSIEDPDATESEPEPTPTPAPRDNRIRIHSAPTDHMSKLRMFNDAAVAQGWHARSERSSS